ncbi:MAG: 30S ribosome-binding factor RbfA [Terriglobia bacterium]
MAGPPRRVDRLADQIRAEIATLIAEELRDPRIGFSTVTRVELAADLSHARVMVSVLGSPEAQQATLDGLSSAAGFIRHEISHRLRLRRSPELVFVLDRGPEAGLKVETVLNELQKPPEES